MIKKHKKMIKINDYWHPELFVLIPVIVYVCIILWMIYKKM